MYNGDERNTDVININSLEDQLPFIFIPELNARFLIDTGSTKSLILPKIAYTFYPNYIFNENFCIKTAHMSTFHNEAAHMPLFEIFKVDQTHQFYIFQFSKNFDGLIGINL